ncbi:MAG: hypothetical protein VB858_02275 [Planctomycetaceae bacterium]
METTHHGIRPAQISARINAVELVWMDWSHWPLTKWEKLVVIPQEGQGNPVRSLKEHGGSPSCR